MIYPSKKMIGALFVLLASVLLVLAVPGSGPAQEKKAAQMNGVDNTKMGAYRALAQHIYGDFQRGDMAAAAELSRVLERIWDKAEEYGGDTALARTNRKLFDDIDKFITPLMDAKSKAPDAAKVKAAFNLYLEKLKLAD
jgi:hypothetical protein